MKRCHKTLKSKIEYDLSKLGQAGVNWAKQLPTYQRILNNDPKEVIAHKTPSEIYFARKCHNLREGGLDEECLPSPEKIRPTKKDRQRHSRQTSQLRKQAQKATRRCDKRSQRRHLRLTTTTTALYSLLYSLYTFKYGKKN